MKGIVLYCLLIIFFLLNQNAECYSNIYLVYYATLNGATGHTGVAIDNYKIVVTEKKVVYGKTIYAYDSIRTGSLTYYDLWPKEDYFNKRLVSSNQEARYYRLPIASCESEITVNSLVVKGIPHKEGYPVDGLIQLASTPYSDMLTSAFLDSIISTGESFNIIRNNCSDFAERAIEFLIKKNIRAKEFVLLGFSTTPNRLFKRIAALEGTKVIKDPGTMVNGIFLLERIIKREILKYNSKSTHHAKDHVFKRHPN